MKKGSFLTLALAMSLLLLSGCGGKALSESETVPAPSAAATHKSEPETVPAKASSPAPTAEPTAEPALLSAKYVEILQSGTYHYSFSVEKYGISEIVESGAKDGMYFQTEVSDTAGYRILVRDGKGCAINMNTGATKEFDPAGQGESMPDYSTIVFQNSSAEGSRVTEAYACKKMSGTEGTLTFVFDGEKLAELSTPELILDGTWPVVTFDDEPPAELFEFPVKTTLAISEIAEGTYTGTLSGDSWANSKGTVFPTIPSAEITVTIHGGQITLYSEARASADGKVDGVAAPHSPEYSVIVSGSLGLVQSSSTVVSAEGKVSMLGETISILYDNGKFTGWKVKERSSGSTYDCTVSVAMANGIPVAEIAVDGSLSHQAATVPLALAAPVAQPAGAVEALWTNVNTSAVENDAKDYYVMFELPACTVTEIETCHYKSGGKEPGQIMLYGEDGSEYGPFATTGRDGQDGIKNAYWVAKIQIDLPAGNYAIADSDQSTWSNNDGTDGWGMATVRGIRE